MEYPKDVRLLWDALHAAFEVAGWRQYRKPMKPGQIWWTP